MGCNFSSDTKVKPFDNTKENTSTPRSNGVIQNSKQNGTVPQSKHNGHIPNKPRETLKQKEVNHEAKNTSIIEETGGQECNTVQPITLQTDDVHSEQDKNDSEHFVQKSNEQTVRSSGERTARSSGERTPTSSERTARGDHTPKSGENTNRSPGEQLVPIVVPTMSVKEEDLFRSQYTIKEVSIHNQSKGYVDIFPLRKNIYSTTKFKEAMKKVVEKKYESLEEDNAVEKYDYSDFYKTWKFSPIYLVLFRFRKMYLRFSDIKTELPTCKVADVLDQGELYEDIMEDSKAMLEDLKSDSGKTKYQEEYMELLQRFLRICDSLLLDTTPDSISSLPPSVIGKDPNTLEFSLPDGVSAESLQPWIVSWEPYDTTVPPHGAWTRLPDQVVNAISDPLELQDICRVSSDGLPDLDFTIDGEVAWNVTEPDIVKLDITTDQQEKIWRSRDNRTDLNDPTFLLRRQTRIEMYFINKYEWDSAKLDPFRGFVTRLQRAWKEFQSLCEIEDFTVVPEDEY